MPKPIGVILVEMGAVTEDQVDDALRRQRTTGKKLGQLLCDQGVATPAQIAEALRRQLGEAIDGFRGH